MRTHTIAGTPMLLLAIALLALIGCGDKKKQDPKPADPSPGVAEPTGPTVPEAGVVWVRVISRETLPALNAPEPMAMTADERRAAVEVGLLSLEPSSRDGVAITCEPRPTGDSVRFWVERNDTVGEDAAVALADELAEAFFASAEARFSDRLEVALLGLGKELDAASAERAGMQESLRHYLDVHRARAGTPETRREQAELERAMSRVIDRVGRMQDLKAELEAMGERSQPWYRRVD